ncbi:MAG: urease accessory protein UreD, partial [SAR324 cluster bacterium]|nr:urease accessory protein UreD [SAR324 cluster bacterium]
MTIGSMKASSEERQLDLVFGISSGKTVLKQAFCAIPYKITRLYHEPRSTLAQLILMSPTPGIFGGDITRLRIHVESGAAVQILTQGATKLHAKDNMKAFQHIEITVEEEAEFHWCGEPLIPFRNADLAQTWDIHVASTGRYFHWDSFTSGRIQHGETWQFKHFTNELKLFRNNDLIAERNHLVLEAEKYDLRFAELIRKLKEKTGKPVVILVDEY